MVVISKMNVLERARKAAMNTNFLDNKRRRIYQTSRGAMFTKMPGGYKNYTPIPKYKNIPGSKIVTRLR
jgi:hypothetical protein